MLIGVFTGVPEWPISKEEALPLGQALAAGIATLPPSAKKSLEKMGMPIMMISAFAQVMLPRIAATVNHYKALNIAEKQIAQTKVAKAQEQVQVIQKAQTEIRSDIADTLGTMY